MADTEWSSSSLSCGSEAAATTAAQQKMLQDIMAMLHANKGTENKPAQSIAQPDNNDEMAETGRDRSPRRANAKASAKPSVFS